MIQIDLEDLLLLVEKLAEKKEDGEAKPEGYESGQLGMITDDPFDSGGGGFSQQDALLLS